MKITASDISLQSQRAFVSERRSVTDLRSSQPGRELRGNATSVEQRQEASVTRQRLVTGDFLDISRSRSPRSGVEIPSGKIEHSDDGELETDDPNLKLTRILMEKLLGKKIKLLAFKPGSPGEDVQVSSPGNAPPAAAGNGTSISRVVSTYEAESTKFNASGKVQTADGKQIDFNLDLSMDREYTSYDVVQITAGKATDPLVVNYEGKAAQLTDARFTFDLNSDGTEESMHFLKPGSAFLSFDKNGSGTIDDGSELFGTSTGNGFAELAAYDEDGNNFIDEGDSIYSKLSLYNKDANGNDQITSLSSAGVGAIYLRSASTEFSLNNLADNSQQGQVRATGVYIGEDGHVGTVQQIDLVTSAPAAAPAEAAPAVAAAPEPPQEHIDIAV